MRRINLFKSVVLATLLLGIPLSAHAVLIGVMATSRNAAYSDFSFTGIDGDADGLLGYTEIVSFSQMIFHDSYLDLDFTSGTCFGRFFDLL